MSRQCPDCHQPLQQEIDYNVMLDVCPRCAGFWFDNTELRQVMRADPLALITLEEKHLPQVQLLPDANADRRCPDCQRLLDRYQYAYDSPITLDACANCEGIWVEDGELEKIDQVLWQHKHPSTPEALQRMKEERAQAALGVEHERAMSRLARLRHLIAVLSHRSAW